MLKLHKERCEESLLTKNKAAQITHLTMLEPVFTNLKAQRVYVPVYASKPFDLFVCLFGCDWIYIYNPSNSSPSPLLFSYVLILATYKHSGKTYYFIINGSTAKTFGTRPYSAGKLMSLSFTGIGAAVGLIASARFHH